MKFFVYITLEAESESEEAAEGMVQGALDNLIGGDILSVNIDEVIEQGAV